MRAPLLKNYQKVMMKILDLTLYNISLTQLLTLRHFIPVKHDGISSEVTGSINFTSSWITRKATTMSMMTMARLRRY